jgi:Tol biopolymer transport system component
MAYPNGQPQRLLDDATWPRLSPDGKKLAYISFNPQTGENNLGIADADGSHPHLVMPAGAFLAVDAPVFSADSQMIMFSAVGGPRLPSLSWLDQLLGVQIAEAHDVASDWWRVSIDGGKPERLTHIGDIGLYADFAPDRQYVAFASLSGIFVMKPDGSNLTQLVRDAIGGSICWTP